jgi:hypothetical protein
LGLLTKADLARLTASGGIADEQWGLLSELWEAVGLTPDPQRLLSDDAHRLSTFRARCAIRPAASKDEVVFPDGISELVASRTYEKAIADRYAQLSPQEAARQVVAHASTRRPPTDATPRPATLFKGSVLCWTVDVANAEPVDWEPLQHTGRALPLAALLSVLDELAEDGWRIRHVSEDRAVDHDANASFVIEARYLLTRY